MKRSIVGTIGVAMAGTFIVACGAQSGQATMGSPNPADSSSASSSRATPTSTSKPVEMVTVPSVIGMTQPEATYALAAVGLYGKYTRTGDNPDYRVITQTPAASSQALKGSTVNATIGETDEQRQAREAAAAASAAADADPSTFQETDERTWALVVKDPDSHIGEKYVIYGVVTQFDSATGTSSFRANTGATPQEHSYGYEFNTYVIADDAKQVGDVVQDDLLKMYVKVQGSLTYDTQIGGSTTVPKVALKSYELIGHDN